MEGSVQVDEGGFPTSTQSTTTDDTSVTDVKAEGQTETQGETGEKPELTEKGTKRDPNPESAVHQELANTRAKLKDFETVLRSPELLRKFAKEAGYSLEEAKAAIEEEKEDLYSADKLQTSEDVAKALNEMKSLSKKETSGYKAEIEALKKQISDFTAREQSDRIVTTMSSEISAVREKYPSLNPKDPSYDKELEKEIGEMYYDLDFDKESNSFRGKVSLANITDRVMRAAGKAGKKASEEAQTDIKVKERGKVTTSSKPSTGESAQSDDPGTAIAQKIARYFKK